MPEPALSADPVLEQFREQITENDRAIVEAINKRLRLVAEIKTTRRRTGCRSSTLPARRGCCAT